jgi:glycosyltransferase involved in cell wall biosynthesis
MAPVEVCMVAYTTYSYDARIRREAETIARTERYSVTLIVPKEGLRRRTYALEGVRVREIRVGQYQGKGKLAYAASYGLFLLYAAVICLSRFLFCRTRVFHIHNMPDLLVFAALLPRVLGAQVVLDVHDTMAETYATKYDNDDSIVRKLLEAEERLSCRLASCVVAVNEKQAQLISQRGVRQGKLNILLNVPDHRLFRTTAPPAGDRTGAKVIYHGTVTKRLGVDLLVRAMAEVTACEPSATLTVIGTGDDVEEFRLLVTELSLDDSVTFTGGVALDKLPAIVCEMDLGVVPNRRSPATQLMLPVKMMEYFAMGVPVVAADLATIRHYAGAETVTYFDPGDEKALAQAICRVLTDPDRRQRQRELGLSFIGRYGWENHQYDLIDLYDRMGQQLGLAQRTQSSESRVWRDRR